MVETLEELYIKGDWTPPFLTEQSSEVPTVEVLVFDTESDEEGKCGRRKKCKQHLGK